MKKILKNTSLSIITLFLTFTFIINVSAAGCDGLDSNRCQETANRTIKPSGGGYIYQPLKSATSNTRKFYGYTKYSTIGITMHGKADVSFGAYYDSYSALYCLDAQYEGGSALHAERFLLESNGGKKTSSYDVAVLSVLTGEGGKGNVITSISGNISDYWARLTAIRALTYTYGYYNSTQVKYANAFYSNLTAVVNWYNGDSSIKATYDALNSEVGLASISSLSGHTNYYYSGSQLNTSMNYYKTALENALEYAKNYSNGTKVENIGIAAGEVKMETVDGTDVFVEKDVVHTLKVSGIEKNENNSFIINGIKFENDAVYRGLTYYIKSVKIGDTLIEGTAQVNSILGKNLVELGYNLNDETTIEITVHFEGWKSSSDPLKEVLKCGQAPIKYYIDGSYSASEAGQFSDYVGTVWYSGVGKTQRYIGVEKKGDKDNTAESLDAVTKYETYLIDACSCVELEEACEIEAGKTGNLNGPDCQDLVESGCGECSILKIQCDVFGDQNACTQADLVCDFTCETDFSKFECCEDNLLMVSEMDNKQVSILGPGPENTKNDNLKACFVSKIDEQCDANDNSCMNTEVKDQNENSYTLGVMNDNKYCTISCKEDYKMEMPTARIVNAGRYFTFKAKIEGTKSCYSNTIDIEQYNKDIIEKQVAMVNAYTEYLKWKAINEAPIQDKTEQRSASPCCPVAVGDGKTQCSCSASDETNEWIEYYVEGAPYINYYVADNGKDYNTGTVVISNNNTTAGFYEDGHVAGYCNSGCCYATCVDGVSGMASTLDANRKAKLQEAITKLQEAKEDYEKTIKLFAQCTDDTWTSKMNYDPNVYYDYEEDYLNKFNKNGEMDRNAYTETTDSETWFCSGENTINNDYTTCSTGAKSSRESTLVTRNYTVCTTDGCVTESRAEYNRVSTANYAKKSSTVSASYRPATLFYNVYPSGEITVNSADNNVPIENGLPVSLGTERGIYKYTVNIEKLGEFYKSTSSDNLGRYVGSNTAVVDPAKLVYNCAYLVNIPKTDGWICDFDDLCTDDCISNCIGPNCPGYCDGDNCIADCVGLGCIYDSAAGPSLFEKEISVSELFPNGTASYNWDSSKNKKAEITIDAIEAKGNSVFDEAPILSITLDPSTAREIKIDNQKEIEIKNIANNNVYYGGYSNNEGISCFALNGYQEIACYSDFITRLLNGEFGKNVVNSKSLIAQDNYRTVGDNNTSYFTPWSGSISETDKIGPSWK